MTWNPLDTPVDYIEFGGLRAPGIATVTGTREYKYDKVATYGADAAIVIYRGKPPLTFQVRIQLFTPEEYAEWGVFRTAVIKPPAAGTASKATSVVHPFLAELGVQSCCIESCTVPENDGTGVWSVTIVASEWKKPKTILSKPEATATTPAAPTDPADILIDNLKSQVQELAK